MKKIVFLGYVVPLTETDVSVAGNKMQWNTVRCLSELEGVEISCVTVSPMASFPRGKMVRYGGKEESLFPGVKNHRVAFWNVPIIKQVSQILSVYRKAKKLVQQENVDTLLCFNLFPQIGIPMR